MAGDSLCERPRNIHLSDVFGLVNNFIVCQMDATMDARLFSIITKHQSHVNSIPRDHNREIPDADSLARIIFIARMIYAIV